MGDFTHDDARAEVAGAKSIEELRGEITALRIEMQKLVQQRTG
jgi:hypothetical protein